MQPTTSISSSRSATRTRVNDYSVSRETAAAIFGQATLHFAERWSATGGLRLSRDEQRVNTITTGVQDSPTQLTGRYDSDDVSWRLDLKYAASDDVMLYGGVSTGFKSGGLVSVAYWRRARRL